MLGGEEPSDWATSTLIPVLARTVRAWVTVWPLAGKSNSAPPLKSMPNMKPRMKMLSRLMMMKTPLIAYQRRRRRMKS